MTNGKSDTKVPPGSRTGPETRWTVLVFMGAGEVPGAASLKTAADDDLEEMKLIGSGFNQVEEASGDDVAPSSSVCLEVLVQAYGLFEVPKRGRVEQGHIEWTDVPEGDRQAEGGRSLERFVNWGVTASGHGDSNPNHHMMLVLWGHSFDFVFGPGRRQNGTVDALDFAELSDALERSLNRAGADEQARLKQSTPVESKFDIVAFDSCDVSTVEIAYQFAPFADYLIASQVGVPLPGWPYNRILERLRYPIGRPMGPTELGAFIVERFCESYNAGRPVSLTLLDLGRAQELFDRAGELANGLGAVMANPSVGAGSWTSLAGRRPISEGLYVDLADLCVSLVRRSDSPRVTAAATALGDFLVSPRLPLVGKSVDGAGKAFIAGFGRNAGRMARLNGVSIYAPQVARGRDFELARTRYHNFRFAQSTRWSDIVHALARL